jgi:hypothetical protein
MEDTEVYKHDNCQHLAFILYLERKIKTLLPPAGFRWIENKKSTIKNCIQSHNIE